MASTYLVALFCASAGRNGEDLGADEEQIVLFVILLFDVTNNKVVALQTHFVKPHPNELSESLLTDDCKTETGLDENVIKNGQPLDHVLEEIDRFLVAKGVHPDHGGKSFSFVTDGQCHLRQLLHPEACTKNITLPSYFCRFFDLRKEFKKFYKTDANKPIKEMLDYLGLQEDQSVEYGVRQCQEMANILHRLVNDGNVFLEPEIINERLEPGICSKNEYVDDNSVVRSRGLPWQSSDQDIARFFKGLNIAKGGVALCLSPQGRRNGEALVRFQSDEHRDLALRRHKHHIGQRYIEVYKATGKDFVNVAGGSNSEAQAFLSRGGQVIIRMRGLPFTATSQQVLEFFAREPNSCDVLDGEDGTLFVHYPDGRSTGDAFVLFASEEEANKGLKKHRDTMGARYIELFKSTTAEVQQVLNRSMDPRNPEQPDGQLPLISSIPQQTAQVPIIPQNLITSGTRKDCIRLRNIPAGAQVTDILTFLGEFSQFIVYQGVHMVYTAQGEPSGEAFIQMDTEESSTHTALSRHRRQMVFANKKRIIDVIQCSGDDMSLVLTSGMPITALPQPGPTPTIQRPILTQGLADFPLRQLSQLPQFPMIDQTITGMKVSTTILPSPPSLGGFPFAQMPQPIPAGFPPTLTQMPQRPASFYPPILYWYPSPPVSPQSFVTPTGPSVIVMRGLPINVTVQDIMAYFQGFSEVTPDTVHLQTGADGKPTGDALITFSTRIEAERAIVERNRRHLGNRFIELFMAS